MDNWIGVAASGGVRKDRHAVRSLCVQIQTYDRTEDSDFKACALRTSAVGAEAIRQPAIYRGRWRRLRY
jgi:hypothetical protein